LAHCCEGGWVVLRLRTVEDNQLDAGTLRRLLCRCQIGRIAHCIDCQGRYMPAVGHGFMQQLEPPSVEFGRQHDNPCDSAARTREACRKTGGDWVLADETANDSGSWEMFVASL